MLLLLGVRITYHLILIFNPLNDFFNVEDDGVFNLALLCPYITEVIFNLVIFYFNFLQPSQSEGPATDRETNPNIEPFIVEKTENTIEILKTTPTMMSGSARAWAFRGDKNRVSQDLASRDGGIPEVN